MGLVTCQAPGCAEPIEVGPRPNGGRPPKYHAPACAQRAYRARKREKKPKSPTGQGPGELSYLNRSRVGADESVDQRASARRGPGYEAFLETDYPRLLDTGEMTANQVAHAHGTSHANVSRWMAAYREDLLAEQERHLKAAQPRSDQAEQAADDFAAFRARYFRVPDSTGQVLGGKPFATPQFHQRWVDEINHAMDGGRKLQILAPPRHGKTQLLNHLCLWLIAKNPNIRIMLVGGSGEIAEDSAQAIKDELENNETLIADFAGPVGRFKPSTRSGKSWSSDRFTIEGRTVTGIRSPTVGASGRGSRILSKDADIIIVDDPEDHESTIQPNRREKTKDWFRTQVLSRKEPHTAIFVIGSRQHSDDLYSMLLEDPSFRSVVETAHDEAVCDSPDDDRDEAHQDCVLFPELRPYSWLMEQRSSLGKALFEQVYLNRPRAEGLAVFDKEEVNACRNPKRAIGHIPDGTNLVAGLDPAATGYQAAVLWAYDIDTRVRYLVDLENEQGGGVPQAKHVMQSWFAKYGCRQWVVEENNFQKAIRESEEIKQFTAANGIAVEGHETMGNKWDPAFGVTAMAPLFEVDEIDGHRHIDLPWADAETQAKVSQIIRQWLNFTQQVQMRQPAYKSDLVMAAWFPERVIRRWRQQFVAEMVVDHAPQGGVQWLSAWGSPPWAA